MLIGCIRCHGPLDGAQLCPMCDYDMEAWNRDIERRLSEAEMWGWSEKHDRAKGR
jgi:hypothetical protein